MRAALYARISKDAEATGMGVARQERECRALAERQGWEVVGVYVDNDMSASSLKRPRPEYQRLIADVRAGLVDAVIARHDDRLHRHPRDAEDFIDLVEETGVKVLLLDGLRDFTTARGRAEVRSEATRAKYESERKGERLRLAHEDLAAQGRWSGGPRPYGYRSVGGGSLDVVAEEAEVVREAAGRALAGETLYSICADLNRRGVASAQGSGWRTPSLKRVLTSPTIAGRRERRGEDAGPAVWAPILDEVTWRRLQATLSRPPRRGRPPSYLLTGGIARCGVCGSALHAQVKRSGVRGYACGGGPDKPGGRFCVSVLAGPLEEEVVERLLHALDSPAVWEAMRGSADREQADALAGRVAEVEARLEDLAATWGRGEISRSEWMAARGAVERDLDEARRGLAKAQGSAAAARVAELAGDGAIREAWSGLGLAERRAIVLAVVDRVVVRTTSVRGRFDPERVEVVWRA
jgi:DNA invertase Pin-like site-specific DNA recombinase